MGNIKGHDQGRQHVRCLEAIKEIKRSAGYVIPVVHNAIPVECYVIRVARNSDNLLLSGTVCRSRFKLGILIADADELEKIFNAPYYIAKNGRPFSAFNHLCTLQIKNAWWFIRRNVLYLNDIKCCAV